MEAIHVWMQRNDGIYGVFRREFGVRESEFEFGPVARGVYIALISTAVPLSFVVRELFLYYVFFLLFLGFGLRPFLERSGIFRYWSALRVTVEDKWDKKYLEKRSREIDRKARDEKYRKSRVRDPKLPKNW